MEIYLIRHTCVGIESGICYGSSDVPLADSFSTECESVKRKLPQIGDWRAYVSPLRRCRKLAEELCPEHIIFDSRLMELDFGEWEEQRWDDIEREVFDAWSADIVNQRCPKGESFLDLSERVVEFWQEICLQTEPHVLIVTHSGVIRALLSHLLGFPLENAMRLTIDYGSLTKIRLLDYGVMLDFINR